MSKKPVANVMIQPAILYIVTVVSIPLLDLVAPLPLTRMSWVTWAGGIAFIVVLLPYQLAMHFWVVLREERYLEAQFGDAYREYFRSVRRWI